MKKAPNFYKSNDAECRGGGPDTWSRRVHLKVTLGKSLVSKLNGGAIEFKSRGPGF